MDRTKGNVNKYVITLIKEDPDFDFGVSVERTKLLFVSTLVVGVVVMEGMDGTAATALIASHGGV
jgi:hypothetical protein